MNKYIEQYIAKKDIKVLRVCFIDSLDVDPTFEDYKEDFQKASNIEGFFEKHQELTPFIQPSDYSEEYWDSLKIDLKRNFSSTRFEHMKEVALIVFKEKVETLMKERNEKLENLIEKKSSTQCSGIEPNSITKKSDSLPNNQPKIDKEKEQKEEVERAKVALQKENEEKRRNRIEAERKRVEEDEYYKRGNDNKNDLSKKEWGVVLSILVIVIILQFNPQKQHQVKVIQNPNQDVKPVVTTTDLTQILPTPIETQILKATATVVLKDQQLATASQNLEQSAAAPVSVKVDQVLEHSAIQRTEQLATSTQNSDQN